MVKRNLFMIFMLGVGLTSIVGCSLKGGNTSTYANIPAVTGYNIEMGGTIVGTQMGYYAIRDTGNSDGDCILLTQLTIDYDKQPSPNYLLITDFAKENISKTTANSTPTLDSSDYTFPLTTILQQSSPYYRGKYFIYMNYKGQKDAGMDYRLTYVTGETATNGMKNIYLQAKSTSEEKNADITILRAFDVQNLIDMYGRDSTVNVSGASTVNVRYLRANLKYITEVKENKPVYKTELFEAVVLRQ